MPRPKQRTGELRERVLAAALAMLEDEGVGGFTTRRVATGAETSTPAVYELFGDKAGLVREVFFEGFRLLRRHLDRVGETTDPRADLEQVLGALRSFSLTNPVLAQVMFSRPFADFDPGPDERAAGASVREFVVHKVTRCVDSGVLEGNVTDVAHVLVALTQGLVAQELAGWLGTTPASVQRRWTLAVASTLDGLTPPTG